MANSTTVIADLKTIFAAGPSAASAANANNATAVSVTGGFSGGTGVYASGTYYGGLMDYAGVTELILTKAQEIATLLARLAANTDSGDPQLSNIVKVLNDFQ